MKKLAFLFIPILLTAIIVFGILKIFVFGDLGKGALQVTSKPFSKVYLNNTYIGTTPLCRCEATSMIRSGDYTLKLIPIDGKTKEFQDKISITKGVLTVVDRKFGASAASEGSVISLEALPDKKSSELLVVTFPDKADVYLDGNYQGKSPYREESVTDSDHALRIKKDGYKDKNVRVRTPAGFKLIAVVYLGLLDEIASPTKSPLASPSSSLTPTPISFAKLGKVRILETPNGFLRVRSEPSLTAIEVARVTTGDLFDILEESTGWYKIKPLSGEIGWVSADYVSKTTN
jgi:hypothetical protein